MEYILGLAVLLPLVGFLLLMAASPHISRRLASIVACTAVLISFLCFLGVLYNYSTNAMKPFDVVFYRWIPLPEIDADMGFHLDALSIVMSLIMTGIGFLIHVYSIGYMEHDEDYARYFACMNLFIFSMLMLVLAGNLAQLFIGWEGVGLASYLLIGFWYTRPAAAAAATKAFIVNRIGDAGLLVGLLLIFRLFGTSNIEEIASRATASPIITVLTLLLFWGAIGKSAQMPLHVWLPDAMEGPTPVSALIHAATMVTAGVYLVVRFHALFMLAPITLNVIAILGSVTAFYAALSAVGQTDLKRVLAYSTVSQLGLMFLACGIGAFYAAMFHLTTHAFVKALLFLSAGNVIHMMQGTTNMEKMGGLMKKFPFTHWFFLIGVLSMSAVPLFAAFYSKDLILEQTHLVGDDSLFFLGLLTTALTAFYLLRAYMLTFLGPMKLDEKIAKAIREAPKVMLIPVLILALLAIFGGLLGSTFDHVAYLEEFLASIGIVLAREEPSTSVYLLPETWMSIGATTLGFLIAIGFYLYYGEYLRSSWNWLRRSFYIDELYQKTIVNPLSSVSRFFSGWMEPAIFEGSINGAVKTTNQSAHLLQTMQSGQIRSYVAWMAIGMAVLYLFLGI